MHDDLVPGRGLVTGRMVVEEQLDDSVAVHVRLDGEVTWQVDPGKGRRRRCWRSATTGQTRMTPRPVAASRPAPHRNSA